MLVLTRQNVDDFEAIDIPCRMISYRYAQEIPLRDNLIHASCSEFSIPEAMISVGSLKQLLNSKARDDEMILNKIVKGAVLLNNFGGVTDKTWQANIASAVNTATHQN